MPRIYPPKYKKPLPKWIGETAFVLVVCFFVTFGWILADMTGMERGLKACLGGDFATQHKEEEKIEVSTIEEPQKTSVRPQILNLASNYGVDSNAALAIADCESKMGKYKTNFSGSSAKGVYQFIDKTWEHYCEGDVMNDEDNIRCFMQLYPKHPDWWQCKG